MKLWEGAAINLNELGQVVYNGRVDDSGLKPNRSYIWSVSGDGTVTRTLIGLPSDPHRTFQSTEVRDINEDGEVVGNAFTGQILGLVSAFRRASTSSVLIPVDPNEEAKTSTTAINAAGSIPVVSYGGISNASQEFIWRKNNSNPLLELVRDPSNAPATLVDVNDDGLVLGHSAISSQGNDAWAKTWGTDGQIQTVIGVPDVPVFLGGPITHVIALALNNAGQVLCYGFGANTTADRTYLYTPGVGLTSFDASDYVSGIDINNRGDILFGNLKVIRDGVTHTVVPYTGAGESSYTLSHPAAMNDNGQIVLRGTQNSSEKEFPLLASPLYSTQENNPLKLRIQLQAWQNTATLTGKISVNLRYGNLTLQTHLNQTVTINATDQNGNLLGPVGSGDLDLPSSLRGNVSVRLELTELKGAGNVDEPIRWLTKKDVVVYPIDGSTMSRHTITMLNGDCFWNADESGKNLVNTDDYQLLSDSFDTILGDAGYSRAADLNGDSIINTDDYLILNNNFDLVGDE